MKGSSIALPCYLSWTLAFPFSSLVDRQATAGIAANLAMDVQAHTWVHNSSFAPLRMPQLPLTREASLMVAFTNDNH